MLAHIHKMKRIKFILLVLVLTLCAGQLWAQEHSKARSPYQPAATFAGDTAAYLEYNYGMRYVQYVGRTVSEILKELEYPPLYVIDIMFLSDYIAGLSLCVHQSGKKPNLFKDYYIFMRFENPPNIYSINYISARHCEVRSNLA